MYKLVEIPLDITQKSCRMLYGVEIYPNDYIGYKDGQLFKLDSTNSKFYIGHVYNVRDGFMKCSILEDKYKTIFGSA